ncbi:MAG: efflux RND transporter permease subunit, partial [Calditrichia bacterium]|nr:efflux RND transporter permease subunit [Calditrichia bacterium]
MRDKPGNKIKALKGSKKQIVKKDIHEMRIWFKKFQAAYGRLLEKILRKPLRSMFLIIAAAIILVSILDVPFVMVSGDTDEIHVQIECNIAYSIEQTTKVVDKAEEGLRNSIGDYTREFICTVGYWETGHGPKFRSHYVGIKIILDPDRKIEDKKLRYRIEEVLDKVHGIDIYDAKAIQGGPPSSSPVKIQVFGSDLDMLEKIAEEIKLLIAAISNTSSINLSMEEGKDEFILVIDESKAAMLGVNISSAAVAVRNAFEGGTATVANSMTGLDEDVDIVVKNNEKRAKTVENLKNIQIRNMRGRYIPLNKFAGFKTKRSIAVIDHEDGERVIEVSSELDDAQRKGFTSKDVNEKLDEKLGPVRKKYPDYKIKFSGEQEEMMDFLVAAAKAGGIALLLIFVILTTLFKSISQTIFVMLVIPFSAVGVIIGLAINNTPNGILPIMGMIALMGVVVNDSLVLVSFVNRLRLEGKDKFSALIEAGKTRLRPILLTTVTTIGGLIPMSYGIMGAESFLQPMGIAIIWG